MISFKNLLLIWQQVVFDFDVNTLPDILNYNITDKFSAPFHRFIISTFFKILTLIFCIFGVMINNNTLAGE